MKSFRATRKFIAGTIVATVGIMSGPASAQADCMMGEIRYFAGNFAPRDWAEAHGQLLAIAQNTALFSILGTTYGGDGRTTFGLPDLRGRTAIGKGRGPGLSEYRLGDRIGKENAQVPSVDIAASNGDVSVVAGGNSVALQSPALVITPVICMNGYYPPRN